MLFNSLNRVTREALWGSGFSRVPLLIRLTRAHVIVTLGAIKHEVYQRCTRGCTLAASLPFNNREITQAIIARVAYRKKRSKEPIIGVAVNSRLRARGNREIPWS